MALLSCLLILRKIFVLQLSRTTRAWSTRCRVIRRRIYIVTGRTRGCYIITVHNSCVIIALFFVMNVCHLYSTCIIIDLRIPYTNEQTNKNTIYISILVKHLKAPFFHICSDVLLAVCIGVSISKCISKQYIILLCRYWAGLSIGYFCFRPLPLSGLWHNRWCRRCISFSYCMEKFRVINMP